MNYTAIKKLLCLYCGKGEMSVFQENEDSSLDSSSDQGEWSEMKQEFKGGLNSRSPDLVID